MIKKTTFLKTLLVAAGLLIGGTSAWAETTVVYEKGTPGNAWAESDVSTFTVSGATLSYSETAGMTFAGQTANSSFYASKTFSHTANSILTVDAVWNGYSNTSAGYTQGAYFSFGNIFVYQNDQNQNSGYGFGGMGTTAVGTFSHGTYRGGTSPNYHIQFTIDTSTNTLTSFSVKSEDDATTWVNITESVILGSYDYTTLKFGFNKTTRTQNAKTSSLISIKITETSQEVTNVDYTVKFQDTAGNTIKDDVVHNNGVVGSVYVATTEDMTTFYNDGNTKKYVYKSGQNESTKATATASDNVITLVFDTYEKFTYSLKYKLGSADAVEQATADIWEDETATIYYPVCRQDGDNYYVVSKNESEPYFGKVMSSSNKDITINYTLDKDIVYYKESEEMAGSRYNYVQAASRTSNGASYCSAASSNSYIATDWTVAANGNYDIEVGMANRNYSVSPAPQLKSEESAEPTATLGAISLNSNSYTIKEYKNQPITAGDQLYFYNDNGTNASKWALDYVILRKAPTTLAVTIKTTGTTFSSAYAIDCSKLPDGVKAYKVASIDKDNKKAILAEVTEAVSANTGLILIATTAGTFDIPVAANGTDISATNLLKAAVTATEVTAGQAYGLKDGKFVKLNAGNVPAGKAYLQASDITNAPELDLDFGGTTAITNTNRTNDTNIREVYNLNGQRVAQPTRGLYIVNGKKVVIK